VLKREEAAQGGRSESYKKLYNDILLTMAAEKRRTGVMPEQIFLIGLNLDAQDLANSVGLPVRQLNPASLLAQSDDDSLLAGLGAFFGQDHTPKPILCNFRSGEFAFKPRLKDFAIAAKVLAGPLIFALAAVVVAVAVVFFLREQQIATLNSEIKEKVVKTLGQEPPGGADSRALWAEVNKLENQLKDLIAPVKTTPLDVLLKLSKEFPSDQSITVNSLNIQNNRVRLEGVANEYTQIEKLDSLLKREKSTFCRVRKNQSSGRTVGNKLPFDFDLFLVCEN
jgi:hypothetical protein